METQVPADLSAVSDEELATLEAALVEEFDGAVEAGSQDIAMLTELADTVDRVRTELSDRTMKAEAAAEALRALADRIHGGAEMEEGETEIEVELPGAMSADTDPAPSAEDTQIVGEPLELAVATSNPAEAIAEVITQEEPAVTASVRKPSAAAVRQYAPQPAAPEPRPEVVITAAADIPGYVAGANIGLLDVAKAMHSKARTLSNGSTRVPVASFSTGIPESNRLTSDLSYNMDVLTRVRNPQTLLASGGWCAPSQNYYELLGLDGGDGLIDLPTVQITRGGINVPDFIAISSATNALWTWTEADDENAGGETIKPCLQIPCPTYTDYRLIAEGLCLTHGNLSDRAFPELTQRFIQLTINAHLHRLSGAIINTIAGGATSYSATNLSGADALGNVLQSLTNARNDFISKNLMPINSFLEVVAPLWTRGLIRNEIAMRMGVAELALSDAAIDEAMRVRGLRVQYVHDYQPWSTGPGEDTDYPSLTKFLMFPAGGYVRGDGGTIDLGVVRDSVLNATNDYTAAWTEQMYLVAQMGPAAYEIEVSTAAANLGGFTGCCPTPA